MTIQTPGFSSLFSADELQAHTPEHEDTFVPKGPKHQALRFTTNLVTKILTGHRYYKTTGGNSDWSFGFTADGQLLGERWGWIKREGSKNYSPAVIDQACWGNKQLLKSELLTWDPHWEFTELPNVRVIPAPDRAPKPATRHIPSRFDK